MTKLSKFEIVTLIAAHADNLALLCLWKDRGPLDEARPTVARIRELVAMLPDTEEEAGPHVETRHPIN